jgi:hypothetical protein
MNSREDNAKTISPELMARIEALEDANLKANILRYLGRPWKRKKSDEQIFEEMLVEHGEVMVQRALELNWRDDEVYDFIEFFKDRSPDDYREFLRQERENNEIEDALWWRVGRLVSVWMPDLSYQEIGLLRSDVRDHFRKLVGK